MSKRKHFNLIFIFSFFFVYQPLILSKYNGFIGNNSKQTYISHKLKEIFVFQMEKKLFLIKTFSRVIFFINLQQNDEEEFPIFL